MAVGRRRGGPMWPPARFRKGFLPCGGFRPAGRVPFSSAKKEPKRRRGELRWASPPIVAHPVPIYGGYPIPLCNISGAQNMVPGLIPSGPLGPSTAQNFGLCYFTAAPGSDQPWQGVRNRRRVDRNCSEHRKRAGRCPAPAALKKSQQTGQKKKQRGVVTMTEQGAERSVLEGPSPL